ncbi:MAG: LysR family transcriptional regulator [Deltaproteobacteria bacterium]|jgi:DNA-binding transcriptional LysR family regulator|nr:LysR family transcriptional regulator [Deltaproteobacteria bacterium]
MDKLKAIRFFLKLCETLSFKGTAAHFGVPPSTVSRSLKALEEELGVSLVERTTRRIRLTEAGEWYRDEVAGPLRALAAADDMAKAQSQEPAGIVRITALPGYGEIRLFPALDRLRAEYPHIVCDLEFTNGYLDLSSGEIDIAIRSTAQPPDYLVAKRLHDNRWILVASPEYIAKNGQPKTYSDIENHPALAYRGPRGVTSWLAILHSGEVVTTPRNLRLITNDGMQIIKVTEAGEGIAFLPHWGVSQSIAEGKLQEITLDDARISLSTGPEPSIFLLYDPSRARLGKIRATVNFLREALSDP